MRMNGKATRFAIHRSLDVERQNQSTKNIIISTLISFIGAAFFWLLQTLFDLGAFLSSCSSIFSHWVASKFVLFIVCPQKVTYSTPTVSSWLLLFAFLLVFIMFVLITYWEWEEHKKVGKFDIIVLLFFMCFLLASSAVHIQSIYAATLYERYCLVNFRVGEFNLEQARQFSIRMSKVATVDEIETVLLEMGQYFQDQLTERDINKADDTIEGGPEAETDSDGN